MIKRSYLPGEDWLYYKIYCGKRTADQLLVEEIQPLVQELTQEERINQWFYLRYSDPQPHLRLRFLSPNTEHRNYLQQRIPVALSSYFQKDLIWKVQMDTYNRELERYGTTTIELSEYVFSVNSQLCLNVLEHLTDDTHVFLISLKVIDELLNSFGYTLDEKINLSKENFEAFKEEFNADKQFKKQLNIKYQQLKEGINSTLKASISSFEFLKTHELYNETYLQVLQRLKVGLSEEAIALDDYLSSQIHMFINRIFRDKLRLHELVCYSCLYRYYNLQKNTNA